MNNLVYTDDAILLAESSNDLKWPLKKWEKSTKTRLHLDITKAKVMPTEETHNLNINNGDIKIIKDFAYLGWVINSNGDCSQIKNKKKAKTQKSNNGRIIMR